MELSRRKFLKDTVAIAVSTALPSVVIARPIEPTKTMSYVRRTGLPKCAWRKLHEGIPATRTIQR